MTRNCLTDQNVTLLCKNVKGSKIKCEELKYNNLDTFTAKFHACRYNKMSAVELWENMNVPRHDNYSDDY